LVSIETQPLEATSIVSPHGFEQTEGDSFGVAPTNFRRVQYLYPASDFSSSVSQQQLVGIAWRPDESTGPFTDSTTSVAVRVSSTSSTTLSTTFADNFGPDETLVFDGPITINTDASTSPRAFDFAVEFQTPFTYDPKSGNLLVEFITSGFDVGGWRVDNQNLPSGPTLVSGNPSDTVAPNIFNTLAVMEFTFAPAPPAISGDFNIDGTVDAADYVVWRKGTGTTYTRTDYDLWRANFGKTAGNGQALPSAEPRPAATPEPVTLMMLVVALILICPRLRATAS
jgi:hypothetical protein